MDNLLDKKRVVRRGARFSALVVVLGGGLVALAACNALTGVNDLNVVPGSSVGTAGSGTGGSATAGASGTAGSATAGTGGSETAGAAGTASGGGLGSACAADSGCLDGLTCVFGVCRTPCTVGLDLACPATSCLTESPTQQGCRLPAEDCPNGELSPTLTCGPDKVFRVACNDLKLCRGDQTCISGTCIGKDEAVSKFGECGKQGKTCDEIGKRVVGCDVGGKAGTTEIPCADPVLCKASTDGIDAVSCRACAKGQTRCSVDVNDGFKVSAEACDDTGSGFKSDTCGGTKPAQCNPTGPACQAIVVDANEVTQAQYEAFVSKVAAPGKIPTDPKLVPAACEGNTVVPDAKCLLTPKVCPATDTAKCGSHPQVCVDWCDAFAYCASKGQHLCGKITSDGTGQMVPSGQFADPGQSEWSNACTVGGRWETALDVGSFSAQADGQKCSAYNAADAPGGVSTYPVDAEALAGCKHAAKGYDHLRNMLGNVREWENSCDKTPEAGEPFDDCHTRGASFADTYANKPSTIADARCDAPQIQQRNTFSDDLGFRCCGTPAVQ